MTTATLPQADALETYHCAEAAYHRRICGISLPGDSLLLVGYDFSKDADRLAGVRSRLSKAGSAEKWQADHAAVAELLPAFEQLEKTNKAKIAELQSQIDALNAEITEASDELKAPQQRIEVMTHSRKMLESDTLLPAFVIEEIKTMTGIAPRGIQSQMSAIQQVINTVKADRDRNLGFNERARVLRTVSTEPGHVYWLKKPGGDVDYETWRGYVAWCNDELAKLEQRLADLQPAELKAQVESLRRFYTAELY